MLTSIVLCAMFGWAWFSAPDSKAYPVRGVLISGPDPVAGSSQISATSIDFTRLLDEGLAFVYLRAAVGDRTVDRFPIHWRSAQRAGMVRGAWMHFDRCADPNAQFERIANLVPNDPRDLPLLISVDWRATCDGTRVDLAGFESYLARVSADRGRPPVVWDRHSSFTEWQPRMETSYVSAPDRVWAFWTYHRFLAVDGVEERVWGAVFRGNDRAFQAFLSGGRVR